MRKVFPNRMVAHVWAQQRQPAGRSGNGQFYFEDVTIYSYGSHFPIATFTTDAHGERCVLVTTDSYGVTTRRHQNHVWNALNGLSVKQWNVALVRSSGNGRPNEHTHKDNVDIMAREAAEFAADLAKPRKRFWLGGEDNAQVRCEALAERVHVIHDYCDAFGVAFPESVKLNDWRVAIREAFAAYNDPKAVEKREKNRASSARRRENAEALTYQRFHAWKEGVLPVLHNDDYRKLGQRDAYDYRQEMYRRNPIKTYHAKGITGEQWCNGENGSIDFYANTRTLVRKNGDKLETSRGADCPWKHAVIAFLKAQQCRREGIACSVWNHVGGKIRVGHFQVDRIDEHGNIYAGCHTLMYDEMLRLAVREVPELVKATYALPVAA